MVTWTSAHMNITPHSPNPTIKLSSNGTWSCFSGLSVRIFAILDDSVEQCVRENLSGVWDSQGNAWLVEKCWFGPAYFSFLFVYTHVATFPQCDFQRTMRFRGVGHGIWNWGAKFKSAHFMISPQCLTVVNSLWCPLKLKLPHHTNVHPLHSHPHPNPSPPTNPFFKLLSCPNLLPPFQYPTSSNSQDESSTKEQRHPPHPRRWRPAKRPEESDRRTAENE